VSEESSTQRSWRIGSTVAHAQGDVPQRVRALARAVREARGAAKIPRLREVLAAWDESDPSRLEPILREVAEDPQLDPRIAVYARVLLGEARRRRGDLAAAEASRGELGFVSTWLVVGPFDNAGRTGLDAALQPELDVMQPIVPGRAFDGKVRPVRY